MRTQFEPGARAGEGFVPLCEPRVGGNEWKYIKDCLDSGWVSSVGAYVDRFERELAAYVGAKYAVAAVNGTAALHLALLVSGVKPGDEVLVSSLTFIAPVNAIRYAGAFPMFIDSEPDYWQIDPVRINDFLTKECTQENGEIRNRHTGRRVKAIIPVHVLGHPVDLDPILEIAQKFKLEVIEDSTECLGAKYKGRRAGAIARSGCFSFNGNKIITTGGGGMLVTDDETLAKKARYLATQAKDDPIEYVHHEVGYNYRLTNIQAAMGCAQLELLDEYIAAKRRIASIYNEAFAKVPGITIMRQAPWAESICWMYTVLINEKKYGEDSRALLKRLAAAKIQARPLWQPVHLSSAHADCKLLPCPVAEELNQTGLSLPCSVGLTSADQQRVIAAICGTKS